MNIFVGNLAWGVDDVALQETFEAHGTVDSARVIHDRETGRSRGFGFVEMPNSDEGQAAIEALEGKDVMGRPIRLMKASNARSVVHSNSTTDLNKKPRMYRGFFIANTFDT